MDTLHNDSGFFRAATDVARADGRKNVLREASSLLNIDFGFCFIELRARNAFQLEGSFPLKNPIKVELVLPRSKWK